MLGKKSSVILSAIGLALASATVHAAVILPPSSLWITIPVIQPGFEFSITGLALKPAASNLNYVIFHRASAPVQTPVWTEQELQPEYDAAFAINGRYYFPEGKDVFIEWTHLNTSETASISAPSTSYFLGPDYQIGPSSTPIRNASGEVQFKYDVVNLDFGQYVQFGDNVRIRFFGGISNASLREQVTSTFSGTSLFISPGSPFRTQQDVTSNFYGTGPRLGFEANYTPGWGIGFLGEMGVSALVGDMRSKTAFTSSAPALQLLFSQSINDQFIKDQTVTQVIPGFDAKLGMSYTYAFDNCLMLSLKAGYEAAVYVNAISQYTPSSLVVPLQAGGIFVSTMAHTLSNYSVQGPFVEAVIRF